MAFLGPGRSRVLCWDDKVSVTPAAVASSYISLSVVFRAQSFYVEQQFVLPGGFVAVRGGQISDRWGRHSFLPQAHMLARQSLIKISPAEALRKSGHVTATGEPLPSPPMPRWVACWVEWNDISSQDLRPAPSQ
jgi:hypothetical protein